MSVDLLYVHLGEVLFRSFAHFLTGLFVFLVWNHVSSLCISRSVRGIIGKHFSHIVGSLFILLMFSLAVQKLFILMKSHLFILSFISLALRDVLVKILLCGISEISLSVRLLCVTTYV